MRREDEHKDEIKPSRSEEEEEGPKQGQGEGEGRYCTPNFREEKLFSSKLSKTVPVLETCNGKTAWKLEVD